MTKGKPKAPDKVALRRDMVGLRALQTDGKKRSQRLRAQLTQTPEWRNASSVASYWPMTERGEIDLRSLHEELWDQGIPLYLPQMLESEKGRFHAHFCQVRSASELVRHPHGFLEPKTSCPKAAPGDIDIVLVPALAADARGHRTGYGAGYYDSILSSFCPPGLSVVTVFDWQLVPEVPIEKHDVACDLVITDRKVIRVAK